MFTLEQLIARAQADLRAAIATRQAAQDALVALRSDANITVEAVNEAVAARDVTDTEVTRSQLHLETLEAEQAREAEVADLQRRVAPTGVQPPAYDRVARVGQEERTYAAHKERGWDAENNRWRMRNGKPASKPGSQFERDVAAAFLGDFDAKDRLVQHMREERAERGDMLTRAVGTGAFAGLTVPQYLTDLYAPAAAARRPFADVCRHHDLPEQGMTVNISRITTSTSAAVQASENSAVSETNIDDTLMTINVQTNAGQQTMSRQSIERGAGTEPVVLDDLFRRYATTLDSTLVNQATNGLTNVATSIAYTDASPTVAELYPKTLQAQAAVEAAMLDMGSGEMLAVMHSRRWYWLQNALSSNWPLMQQPGTPPQSAMINYAESYGRGFRGLLPNGCPVIVDNNVATNLGAGTNEDEIYFGDRDEFHLWEDPSAPMFIRAEQPAAASLGVLLVVYGYFAYTHARYAHSQKLGGTGLVTPAFTGV